MTREVPLTQGYVALVDDEDYDAVMRAGRWQLSACGDHLYAGHAFKQGSIRLHTFLTGWSLIDHVNGDGLDNRRCNLRPATQAQNNANMRRPRDNTSGYKGVNLYKRTGRWRATLTHQRRARHLGYYATAEEAARVYDAAASALWGEYARLNFPEEKAS
jgi:hypothetical protein